MHGLFPIKTCVSCTLLNPLPLILIIEPPKILPEFGLKDWTLAIPVTNTLPMAFPTAILKKKLYLESELRIKEYLVD